MGAVDDGARRLLADERAELFGDRLPERFELLDRASRSSLERQARAAVEAPDVDEGAAALWREMHRPATWGETGPPVLRSVRFDEASEQARAWYLRRVRVARGEEEPRRRAPRRRVANDATSRRPEPEAFF